MLICITGIRGAGKTTAMKMLKEMGAKTFVTDNYIKSIYKHGKIGYDLILKNFGSEYVTNSAVNNEKLGELVFNKSSQLKKLNKIMMPVIYDKINSLKHHKNDVFVELAIYMNHEKFFKNLFEKVVLIKSKSGKRNILNKKNKNPIKNKKIFCHFIVENTSDFNALKNQLRKKVLLE